jgi:hypothetical protein
MTGFGPVSERQLRSPVGSTAMGKRGDGRKAAPGARIWRAYMYASWLDDLLEGTNLPASWGWRASFGGWGATFRGALGPGGF